MKSKAAIQVEYGGPLVIEEIDIPILVRTRSWSATSRAVCAIPRCTSCATPGLPRPMGLGHEGSGVVTHVGKEVTHVKEGDHVISTWVPRIPISGLPVSKLYSASEASVCRRSAPPLLLALIPLSRWT